VVVGGVVLVEERLKLDGSFGSRGGLMRIKDIVSPL
jgi:hypothetical protein